MAGTGVYAGSSSGAYRLARLLLEFPHVVTLASLLMLVVAVKASAARKPPTVAKPASLLARFSYVPNKGPRPGLCQLIDAASMAIWFDSTLPSFGLWGLCTYDHGHRCNGEAMGFARPMQQLLRVRSCLGWPA